MSEQTAAQVLHRAAQLLGKRGWTQEELVSADGEVCLLGAVAAAVDTPNNYGTLHYRLKQVARHKATTHVFHSWRRVLREALDCLHQQVRDSLGDNWLRVPLEHRGRPASWWNDFYATSRQQVQELLTAAANTAQEEEKEGCGVA